jgi:hypothetical protein
MGLSKRKESTNLVKLRIELNRLNTEDKDIDQNKHAEFPVTKSTNPSTGGSGAIIKEAKKKAKKRNELIDGSKLLCSI